MSDYSEALRAELDAVLDETPRAKPMDVVVRMRREHPDLVAAEAGRLMDAAMVRDIKAMARAEAVDSGQMTFHLGFPRVFTVTVADGYELVRYDRAVFADIEVQEGLMVKNVAAAQSKLDTFRAAKAEVRPLMDGTGMTLGEAMAVLAARDVTEPEDDE